MGLSLVDFLVIILYFAILFGVALYTRKRASGSTSDFFLSSRNATWWLAGTSMVATTFAADTPLAVTELVAKNGIAGNWIWWSMVFSGMLTVFFYAKLWRRSGVLTDVEFAEIRYSGKPAAFLRGFRALYLGLPINIIIMGWVTLAMVTILSETLKIDRSTAVIICLGLMIVSAFVTSLSGLAGLLIMDFFQFILKMGVVILLAVFAVSAIGGMGALKDKLIQIDSTGSIMSFTPDLNSAWMPMITFFVYIAVNWWASWYPGAEPGGGGYIAQRIFSAKNEKHSILATLWFNIAHYAVRPWPWILVALVAVVQLQNDPAFIANPRVGYVKMMLTYMPDSLKGLMIAGFLAAFLSTISSSLNWGCSLIVNDFYRRFLVKDKSEKYYVTVSRITTIILMIIAAISSFFMESISGAWKFLIAIGAGTGLVFILRWFWWRINAWSEISAMASALIVSLGLQYVFQSVYNVNMDDPKIFAYMVLITTSITTIIWLIVTFLTKPEPEEKLISFYRRVRPSAMLWKPIAEKVTDVVPQKDGMFNLLDWIAGCVLIYMTLFGVGHILFGNWILGLVFLVVAIIAMLVIYFDLNKRGWETLSK
ncbi:MAG TPA: Na+:solute symporter [Bacteroidota bacterium]|jgi:Na+/proline symporter|nr:Na+:solute symporter [Bacteroidota bacterium]